MTKDTVEKKTNDVVIELTKFDRHIFININSTDLKTKETVKEAKKLFHDVWTKGD